MVKVLVSGCIEDESKWNLLKSRVNELHTGKHGPFDFVILIPGGSGETYSSDGFPIPIISSNHEESLNIIFVNKLEQPPVKDFDVLVSENLPENSGASSEAKTDTLTAMWALATCPRYHFSGGSTTFFQRAPYRNLKGKPITRLITLAPVGSSEKWIHALNIPKEISLVEPAGTTENPYLRRQETSRQSTSFFFSQEDAKQKKKTRVQDHTNNTKRNKRIEPRLDCWFCLASSTCEKHLIAHIGDEIYLALPKGGVIMEHALIVPISHETSFADFLKNAGDEGINEVIELIHKVEKAFAKGGYAVMITDRSLTFDKAPQQHAYLELLPIPANKLDILESTFLAEAHLKKLDFQPVGQGTLQTNLEQIKSFEQYVFVSLPGGKAFVHRAVKDQLASPEGRFSLLQFGRTITCQLLDCPEKISWKSCVVSKEKETTWTKKISDILAPE